MALVCPHCREVSVSKAAPDQGLVETPSAERVRAVEPALAPKSAQASRPEPSSSPSAPSTTVPSVLQYCPKCAAPKKGETESCAQCGLFFERFDPAEFQLDEKLEALWAQAELAAERTDSERAHLAFLDAASRQGELSEAVRRYRLLEAKYPGHPIAAKMRAQATARLMAIVQMSEEEGEGERPRRRLGRGMKALLLSVAFAIAIALLLKLLAGVGEVAKTIPSLQ